jgi:hypothetical protein
MFGMRTKFEDDGAAKALAQQRLAIEDWPRKRLARMSCVAISWLETPRQIRQLTATS